MHAMRIRRFLILSESAVLALRAWTKTFFCTLLFLRLRRKMGSFAGHLYPGLVFATLALWWTFQSLNRYFRSLHTNTRFQSSITYPCTCLCGKLQHWPVESIIKISLLMLHFSVEMYRVSTIECYYECGQHATMVFFFILGSAVEIMVHYKVPLPKDIEYLTNILAVAIEGMMFGYILKAETN